jgi:hypothetical protein
LGKLKFENSKKSIMSSTTNDISKLFKQQEKMAKELSLAKDLIVGLEKRIVALEEGNGENLNNSSFPPFILDGPDGYLHYLTTTFRNELEEKFSYLEHIQPMR